MTGGRLCYLFWLCLLEIWACILCILNMNLKRIFLNVVNMWEMKSLSTFFLVDIFIASTISHTTDVTSSNIAKFDYPWKDSWTLKIAEKDDRGSCFIYRNSFCVVRLCNPCTLRSVGTRSADRQTDRQTDRQRVAGRSSEIQIFCKVYILNCISIYEYLFTPFFMFHLNAYI